MTLRREKQPLSTVNIQSHVANSAQPSHDLFVQVSWLASCSNPGIVSREACLDPERAGFMHGGGVTLHNPLSVDFDGKRRSY